jgi:DeoR/GlpR family transcriptional regulator of sugar metabolism
MDKKQEILELLKKEGELSFSKICGMIRSNPYYAERYLNELEAEKKIKKEVRGTFTFYKIKEVKDK